MKRSGSEKAGLDFTPVAETIERELAASALPSAAVAAAVDGEFVWEAAFGWADRENRIPATPHTPYSLASISKPITTTALMLLVAQGKLDLDASANDYLGEAKIRAVSGSTGGATLRRIANHTSGLPLHYQFYYADEPYVRPHMDETIRRYANLVREPGERTQYSNLGYGILDYIISRVSRETYKDFMRREVFIPLGMFRSAVDLTPELEPFQAVRYGSDGVRYPFYDFDHPGGSAIYASAHDLVRFGMLHAGSLMKDQTQILSPELLACMQIQTSAPGEQAGFGVGWHSDTDSKGVRLISHSGGMGGVATLLCVVPEHRVVVAALTNGSSGVHRIAVEKMIDVLLPDVAARRNARNDTGKARKPPKLKAFKPGKELGGEWYGEVHTHKGRLPITIRFKSSGDVHVKIGTQLTTLVNEIKFADGELKGMFTGDIGTEDANRRPYLLHLDLKLRGDVLNGCIIAITNSVDGEGGAPGKRMGNALSYAAEVKRGA